MTPSQKFRVENFTPGIDQFITALEQRLSAYEYIASLFGLYDKLDNMSPVDIQAAAAKLVNAYQDDLDDSLGIELVQFVEFRKTFKDDEFDKVNERRKLHVQTTS